MLTFEKSKINFEAMKNTSANYFSRRLIFSGNDEQNLFSFENVRISSLKYVSGARMKNRIKIFSIYPEISKAVQDCFMHSIMHNTTFAFKINHPGPGYTVNTLL